MVIYEETYAISFFSKSCIKIHIPKEVYIYQIEIDALNSKWGPFFDICIMDEKEIIFIGSLDKNIKQISLPKRLSAKTFYNIYISPNELLYKISTNWMVLNDDIKIELRGYKLTSEVKYEPMWEDESFKEEWG